MADDQTLTSGDASITIDASAGGRLSSFVLLGHEILVPAVADRPMEWGSFPMIPWAGRIREGRFHHQGRAISLPRGLPPHAIHGTTYVLPWEFVGPGSLTTDLGDEWPWVGVASQSFGLTDDGLRCTITIENRDETPMPVSAGWHPWFRRTVAGSEVSIDLPPCRMRQRDADGIPDGTSVEPPPPPWDDCFSELTGPVMLRWPGFASLTIESDCEHVVVYDEAPQGVCVEPQSAPPDAHNSGHDLVEIPSGGAWSVSTTWRWTRAPSGSDTPSTTLRP